MLHYRAAGNNPSLARGRGHDKITMWETARDNYPEAADNRDMSPYDRGEVCASPARLEDNPRTAARLLELF